MKTIALENIIVDTILGFCENLAELGLPKDCKEPDMWFRYLSRKEQLKVADKLLEIENRDDKRFNEGKKKVTTKHRKSK